MDNSQPKRVKGNLLVVDDDLFTRKTLEAFLPREGYEVRCAADGQMALMFAREEPPELILLDIRLPDIDGFQVCRRLKEDPRTAAIPVIFISGLDEAVDKVKGFAAGGVDYITKPFQGEEVLARVGLHLELRRAKEVLQRANEGLDQQVKVRTADLARANEQLVASEKALAERLRFETLLADISAHFVSLDAGRLDSEIEDAQRRICEFLDLDRSSLGQVSERKPGALILDHIYQRQGSPPVPVQPNVIDLFPWAARKLLAGETLIVEKISDLPPEAGDDRENCSRYGIKSVVAVPFSVGGRASFGFLTFSSLREERDWTETLVKGFHLIAEVFANALARKSAEEALRQSEARLSLSTDAAGAGLWIMEPGTGHVWVTTKTRELMNFPLDEELTYERFFEAIHPKDRGRFEQALQQASQGGEDLRSEYRIVRPDGSIRWIVARGKRHLYSAGGPEGMMGVSLDISERKELEQRLQERLQEVESLKQRLEKENIYLQEEIKLQYLHQEIIGRSEKMKKALSQVEQVARTDSTVLIQGETGTGKELLARAIHHLSSRKDRLLVTVNCASLPPTLIESELFGREKGAYTGALTRMEGRFEVADGATLFLDEIGELAPGIQSKLLRVLEEGQFERLGSTKTLQMNVRIIAATNRDLAQDVNEGKFRKDLYYRLNVFPIAIPPLRERPEDILPLVWAFVRQFEKKMGKRVDAISRKSSETLLHHTWPGNARELRNVIEHAMIVSSGRNLTITLPQTGLPGAPEACSLQDLERRHILGVLEKTGWRLAGEGGASEILGLKRTTLQWRMKKLGLRRPAR